MLVRILWKKKYRKILECILLVIYIFWIWSMHGRWNILKYKRKVDPHPRPCHEDVRGSWGTAPLTLNLGSIWRHLDSFHSAALQMGKESGTHAKRGWVGPTADIDGLKTRKPYCTSRSSNSGLSSPWHNRYAFWMFGTTSRTKGRHILQGTCYLRAKSYWMTVCDVINDSEGSNTIILYYSRFLANYFNFVLFHLIELGYRLLGA